jgi:hypothetical protein
VLRHPTFRSTTFALPFDPCSAVEPIRDWRRRKDTSVAERGGCAAGAAAIRSNGVYDTVCEVRVQIEVRSG